MISYHSADGIRRYPDNTVDFDFYRRRAAALRSRARRDAAKLRIARNVAVTVLSGFVLIATAAALVVTTPEGQSASAHLMRTSIR